MKQILGRYVKLRDHFTTPSSNNNKKKHRTKLYIFFFEKLTKRKPPCIVHMPPACPQTRTR